MRKHIEKALTIVSMMRVDGDNQDLAVAVKQELRKALDLLSSREYTLANFEKPKEDEQ